MLKKHERLRSLALPILGVLSGCAGADDNCLVLSDAFHNHQPLVSELRKKGWRIQNVGKDGSCTPSHSLRIDATGRVNFGDGYTGHYGVASFANLKVAETSSLVAATGPNQSHVVDRLVNALLEDIPAAK